MSKIVPIQQLCPESKWNIKCPYSMEAEEICVHNTANDASAKNEITYMNSNNNKVSFHFAIDDKEVRQGLRLDRNGWHAGDGGNGRGNRKSIGIEICYSLSGGERFVKAEKLAAKFIAQLLVERNWSINKVRKHQDYSGKYCPHRTLDLGWQRFINMIKAELDSAGSGNLAPTPAPIPDSNDTYRTVVTLKGYYTSDDAIKGNSPRTILNPDTYYVFNKKGSAYNLTKKKGTPGAWVNIELNVPQNPNYEAGKKLNLKDTNLYSSSSSQRRSTTVTGEYFIWSDQVVNGRVRITRPSTNIGKAGQVTGWVNATDASCSSSTPAPSKKSVEEVAREVINGKWGNGQDRINRLKSEGYNPEEVQKEVNRILGNKGGSNSSISKGDKVRFKSTATTWVNGVHIPSWVKGSVLYVLKDPKDGKVSISIKQEGPETGPARVSDVYKV